MAPNAVDLDDHQKFILMKFRRSVSDITEPHHDDKFLFRWLKVCSWDEVAAEKMLRESLKWRQRWEVDGALKMWQLPEVINLYAPHGTSGRDKDGAPVIIIPIAGVDVVGFLHCLSKQDIIKCAIQLLERYLDMAATKNQHQLVVIFDLQGFHLKKYAWKPAVDIFITLIRIYEANYPDILKCCYIIHAPRIFGIVFNVIRKFLNESSISRIHIFKKHSQSWKRKLLENIDPENLPIHWGGNLADPDGNPKCITLIKQGGKIPRDFYKNSFEQGPQWDNEKRYTTVVIGRGDKLILEYPVTEEGCFLKWDFRTKSHDIRFDVSLKDADGKNTTVVRQKRVSANKTDESGVVACQALATYTITFDNSYSFFRSKKLYYNIEVTPPLEKLNILPTEVGTSDVTKSEIIKSL